MKPIYLAAAAACAVGLAPAALAAPAQPMKATKSCALENFQAPDDTTLVSAQSIDAPVKYCRLDGYVTTNNPGPNRVKFMLAVPENWNGRFLFTVQGGAAGWVPDPTKEHLQEGYAIASTDKGVVTSGPLDFSFRANPAMKTDWDHRGTHVAARATQAIARSYYDRSSFYRYVMGCSGGGIGTLTEAERYPEDFDGYIVGAIPPAPPYSSTLNWAGIAWRMSNVPGSWISPQEYERIHEALLAKYDASDSAVDGLIWDPRIIKLNAGDRKTLSFLTDAQFGTLKLITQGIKDRDGKVLAHGYLLGNPKRWALFLTGRTAPPWPNQQAYPYGFIVSDTTAKAAMGPNFSLLKDVDFAHLTTPVPGLDPTEFDINRLAKVRQTGGKVLMWVGAAEEAVSPLSLIAYGDLARQKFGPTTPNFMRTFTIPGLHHCLNGDNAPTNHIDRMLKASQAWVEEGKAPDEVIVSNGPRGGGIPDFRNAPPGPTVVTRTYRLCALPMRSVFIGGVKNPRKLDVNDAKNWRCAAPAKGAKS